MSLGRLWAVWLLVTMLPLWAQTNPPFVLVPLTNHVWRYDASGANLGTAWRAPAFNDSTWISGLGLLAFENQTLIASLTRTTLPLESSPGNRIATYYFRTSFVFTNEPEDVYLLASNYLDDGAVFYLNGVEAFRYNLPQGDISANTLALAANPAGEGVPVVAELPTALLVPGTNLLAVEVHQNSLTSADIVFGTALIVKPIPPGPPIIGMQPVAGTNVAPGGQISLSVSNAGGPRVRYQWFRNGLEVAAATNRILTLSNVAPEAGGRYFVTLSNSYGAVTSTVASLSVTDLSMAQRFLEFTNLWRFDASGTNLGTAWRAPGYNDSAWPTGAGVFINPRTTLFTFPEPTNAVLSLTNANGNAVTTFYFRTHFALPPGFSNVILLASNLLDDGAVFYLNGAEAARVRLPAGPIAVTNFAQSAIGNGQSYEALFLPATNLLMGDNVLAVEVHQSVPTSSDIVFGMNLLGLPAWDHGLLLLSEPASQVLPERSPVTWRANVFGSLPVLVQWFHNGSPLPTGTNLVLAIPEAHAAHAGSYYFIAGNYVNSVTSSVVSLTVLPDTNAAHVARVVGTNGLQGILVEFSEAVAFSATNIVNYQLSPAVSILSAEFLAPNLVLLTTSGLDLLSDYTLLISNLVDRADTPNATPPFSVRVRPNRIPVATGLLQVQTVFLIMMENHPWASIRGNTNAPYLNSLLPFASYCENYVGDALNSPAWLMIEAGDFFGIVDGDSPVVGATTSSNHLVRQLFDSGIEWRGYFEDLPPGTDGTLDSGPIGNDNPPYTAWRNPFAFFKDVTTNLNYCTNHVRPYSYFANDLTNAQIGRYNYITANSTNSMRNPSVLAGNPVKTGDAWLARELPRILNSPAYSNNGAVFITWDENLQSSDPLLGMIVLSPLVKGGGYASPLPYTHSSVLRTMQEIFGVRPYLGKAAQSEPLNDLFRDLSVSVTRSNIHYVVTARDLLPGRTNYLQASSDLLTWSTLATNVASTTFSALDPVANAPQRFYRAIQR